MPGQSERTIRVLAADDSAVMRGILRSLFVAHAEDGASDLPRMELCAVARDGVECLDAVRRLRPDVLVLDLEMPRMHGLNVLERLRQESPSLPVIMCSSYTERGARSTLAALAVGASDYVMKPDGQRDFESALAWLSQQLLPRIAALALGDAKREEDAGSMVALDKCHEANADVPIEVVVIGLSTGGPSALELLLPALPLGFPVPVLIVQHMPKLFTGALAERLDQCCALEVKEAHHGAALRPGVVWLAPGDSHMEVVPGKARMGERTDSGSEGQIRLHRQDLLNHCRPSVDYLFRSAARMYGAGTLAVVMTGMGSDGLGGARAVHEGGGVVITQDKASSAVWGMPGRVTEAGIAGATLPLMKIAGALQSRVSVGRPMRQGIARRISAATISRTEVIHGLL